MGKAKGKNLAMKNGPGSKGLHDVNSVLFSFGFIILMHNAYVYL